MNLQQKIGQLFFIGLPGTEFADDTKSLITDIRPGGVCLFARNCKNATDVRSLLDSIRENSDRTPLLSLDQEGGLVDRLRRIAEPLPSAADVSKKEDVSDVVELARITAEIIRMLGFNLNFAPVVDVTDKERFGYTNGLHSRAFGSSLEDVLKFSNAYLKELNSGGIAACIKHFPGTGAMKVDSHEELSSVLLNRDELDSYDLVPYKELLGSDHVLSVMVGHTVFPNHDLQDKDANGNFLPTSLSKGFIDGLLRKELGFEGVVLTDDLEMGAIMNHYGIGEASIMALEAGSDFLLICNDKSNIYAAYEAVFDAVRSGRISEERIDQSLERIERFRGLLKPPLELSIERIEELSRDTKELKNGGIS